jgi:hypothetical protein
MHTPLTTRGEEYRKIGYWFATGWWYAQPRAQFVPDRSQKFAEFCAALADEYALEKTHYLPSVLGMWDQFVRDVIFAAPNPDSALTFDQCEAAGLDPTGRFHP